MCARAETAPPEVVQSAVAAVEVLGKSVVLGDHKMAVQKMYPQWKQRMAKRAGGIEKLEEQLSKVGQEMARQGVSIIDFKTAGEPKSYGIWPGEGHTEEEPVYTKWLCLVPTVTTWRIIKRNEETPKPVVVNMRSFQVAIADKADMQWNFINGTDASVAALRGMFTSLPANLELPPVRQEEVK